MNEEYLWNRTGEVDPEIAKLESLLAPLQYRPDTSRPRESLLGVAPARRRVWWWAAGLAAAAVLIVGLSMLPRLRSTAQPVESTWKVSWNDSSPHAVQRGQVIDTGAHSAARLESDFVGEVRLDSNSRLRLIDSTKERQTLALEHGTIHAYIWAPPREFVVNTPSSTTIDLGCQYTLQVAHDGTGLLNVEMGWVAFQWHNLESFIPAGAACITRPERGPGIPYFADAKPELRAAVAQFDVDSNRKALHDVLDTARPHDALTLWHLLSRTQGAERGEVFDRFAQLVKVPPRVTKEKILA
ncbi:MAG: FecR domain-containing protein, partial [Bryobacteraceae bacterium]